MKTYNIPAAQWDRLMHTIEVLQVKLELLDTLSEEQLADLLGVKVKTIQNGRSSGKIPNDCYKKLEVGNPVYFKSKLLGL